MEQRLLRLGEIVDDYCPRERRVTNHAIVALVGDTIKQTRCATCDTEHVYKGGRIPARKKKNDVAALETAVLASVNGTQLVARIDPTQAASTRPAEPKPGDQPMAAGAAENGAQPEPQPGEAPAADDPTTGAGTSDEPLAGGWIGHRTLIRASLPRTEGEVPPPRPIPEFTMHQRQTRGSHSFRQGNGWGGGGDRQGRGGFRGNGHAGGSGSGNGSGNEVNGNRANSNTNGFSHHHQGGGFGGNGNPGQGGRPPGQGGKRHRHGKHRRPR